MDKFILWCKKAWAFIKIVIPFTKITYKNIKDVLHELEESAYWRSMN